MRKKSNKRKVYLLRPLRMFFVITTVIVMLIGSKELISVYIIGDNLSENRNADGYNISNFNEIEHRVDNIVYAADINGLNDNKDYDSEVDSNINLDNDNTNNNNSINNNGTNSDNVINNSNGMNNGNNTDNNTNNDNNINNNNEDNTTNNNVNINNDNKGTDIDVTASGETDFVDNEQKKEKKLIALTFDDGPYESVTNRILDILDRYGAKATFFVMGNRVLDYPKTVKRVFEEGHEIANHTYSHKQLTKLKEKEIKYEVEYSNEMINQVVEVGAILLRPPYGDHNTLVDDTVKVPMITWSIDSLDWKSRDKDKVIEQIKATLHDNAIILMHDLYETTADAVEELIPYLQEKGYELVTVSELFMRNGIELEAGKVYRNAVKK